MSHSHHISSRFIRRIALGLAVAAIAAPSAAASEPYSPLYTRTDPGTVVLPAVGVTSDGFLTAKVPPIRVALPAVEVTSDGFLTAKVPPIRVALPAVEVTPEGFLTAKRT